MELLTQHAIFFTYSGLAFAVALVSILWGSPSKIMGASFLLASIFISNIAYSLFKLGLFPIAQFAVILAVMDFCWACAFFVIARRSNVLEKNKWATFVAVVEIGMLMTDLVGVGLESFLRSPRFGLALNLLLILALFMCFIGFVPKSREEAIHVLRLKWMYLKHDLFGRIVATFHREQVEGVGQRKKRTMANNIDIHIGRKIREARITRNLTMMQLANELGVTTAQIQKYENGVNRVSASSLFVLSTYFEIDAGYFYNGLEVSPGSKLVRS